MVELVRNKRPPVALNLRGRATLVISVKETPAGGVYHLEMAVVVPRPHGSRASGRRVISSRKCVGEAAMWMTIRDLADGRVAELAEMHMDAPEGFGT